MLELTNLFFEFLPFSILWCCLSGVFCFAVQISDHNNPNPFFLIYSKIADVFRQAIPTRIPKSKATTTTVVPVKTPTGQLMTPLQDSKDGKLHTTRSIPNAVTQNGGKR